MSWTCLIPGDPVAKARPRATIRGGHAAVYTPEKSATWESDAAWTMRREWNDVTLDEATTVTIDAIFKRPKAMCWKRRPTPRVPHTKRPDADNIAKATLDAMQKAGIIRDDSIVHDLTVRKWIASGEDVVGVIVRMEVAT